MKIYFKEIWMVLLCCSSIAEASENGPFSYRTRDGKAYQIELFEQPVLPSSAKKKLNKAPVIFKYGDLIYKAIQVKKQYPERNVTLDFATYKMAKNIYVGFDPEDRKTYGTVAGKDYGGDSTTKLVYLFVMAAKADVKVRLLLHKGPVTAKQDISSTRKYLEDPDTWGGRANLAKFGKNLEMKQILWGASSDQQMHNKFLLASHGESNGQHLTYVTTTNVDEWNGYFPKKNHSQSAVLISNHEALYGKYRDYFELMFDDKVLRDQDAFADAVERSRAAGTLNYVEPQNDPYVAAYFYPVKRASDYWNAKANPFEGILAKLANCRQRQRSISMNMAYLREDFWKPFSERVERAGATNLDVQFRIYSSDVSQFPRWVNSCKKGYKSHSKNFQFALFDTPTASEKTYLSLIGSTNAKENGYLTKANSILVLKDKPGEKRIYNALRKMYLP